MPIISSIELSSSLHIQPLGQAGQRISKKLMKWLRLDELNEMYERHKELDAIEFIDAILSELGIVVTIMDSELHRIPAKGPFLLAANHPLGGIDGLILLKLLLQIHPESKLVANYLLKRISPLKDHLCLVNPFDRQRHSESSISGIRSMVKLLNAGIPIGIFPAGEVSARHSKNYMHIEDREWNESIVKLLFRTEAIVVPIYFHARNSEWFYFLSYINPLLRTVSLPSEMLKGRGKEVIVRIANPVSMAEREHFRDHATFGKYIRRKIYSLASALHKEQKRIKKSQSGIVDIAKPECKQAYIQQLELARSDAFLGSTGEYELFLMRLASTSPVLQELGRLREITFREVGEGSGKCLDIDAFDTLYEHLILWSSKHQGIVGSYRIGKGSILLSKGNLSNIYCAESFEFHSRLIPFLSQSIELGRAFIIKEYQQKPLPLLMLWKGIALVAKRHKHCQFLIGSVSISDQYCLLSQQAMIQFLSDYHMDHNLAQFIRPIKPFAPRISDKNKMDITHLKMLDNFINEIELSKKRVPILLKKYLSLNAKVLGFNVDVNFSNSIDCLIYIKLSDIDIKKYSL